MQNRYIGDVGDFGKYGLLRSLMGVGESPTPHHSLRLGVVWYLYPDELDNSDGKFDQYLDGSEINHARFGECDRPLYDELQCLRKKQDRNIADVRSSGILPSNTLYYEQSLSYLRNQSRFSRQATRENWLKNAQEATTEADVIFVDPDNGISETADPLRKNGPKFVFIEDLRHFAQRDQSLVIYHHLGRRGKAVEQIKHLSERLRSTLNVLCRVWSLWYHRGTARTYFIVAQERHQPILASRLTTFVNSPWSAHFDLVPKEQDASILTPKFVV